MPLMYLPNYAAAGMTFRQIIVHTQSPPACKGLSRNEIDVE